MNPKEDKNEKNTSRAKRKAWDHPNFWRAEELGFVKCRRVEAGRVWWNWYRIQQGWLGSDRRTSMKAFCEDHGLPYEQVRRRLRRRDRDNACGSLDSLNRLVHEATVLLCQADHESDTERMRAIALRATCNVEAFVKYVAVHLTNIMDDGSKTVNFRLDAEAVNQLAFIHGVASAMLAKVAKIR